MRRAWRRLRYWLRSDQRAELLRQEMEFHLDAMVHDFMQQGMTQRDALSAARRKFGNMTQKTEDSRSTWIARWLTDAAQDLRYTFRTLRRDAGFTVFAILIVGLGIGASSTIFSVVNALLLRPLPFHDPSRLVWIAGDAKDGDLSGQTLQVGHVVDLQKSNQSFSGIAGYMAFYGVGDAKLTGDGEPERLSEVAVSQNFFTLLGVQPLIGRLFNDDECKWKGPQAVILSYALWKRRFASDPRIVGSKIILNEAPVTVAGVLPATFDFGSVYAPGTRIDLFSAFPLTPETNRWGNTMAIVGRLKPGVSVKTAQAEFSLLGDQLTKQHPDRNDLTPRLSLLEEHVSGRLRPALLVLACAVGVVMLIVCANLSNLQLARAAARQKEMAVRMALGAGRHRLIRQMLTENLVLSCAGASLGLLLAYAGTRILSRLNAISIPLLDSVHLDGRVLAFTLLTAVFAGLIFGVAPALQIPALAVHDSLKESSRGSSQGRRHAWMRSVLVISEITFACILLVGAGLLIRSFLQVLDVNLGFHPERAAALRIDPGRQYSTQALRNTYFDEALRRVRDLPGIEAAGLTDALPLGRNRSWGAAAKGQVYKRDEYPVAFVRIVTDGYFKAMGISLVAGRDFAATDSMSTKPVIIVNQTMARHLWPGQNPLGQFIASKPDVEVIGVVADVRHLALEQTSGNEMYLPIRQVDDYASVDLVVRTGLPPAGMAAAVRAALKPIEPNLPANEFRTLQQLVDKSVSPRRFVVLLLAGFAAFALILASLGIYGVISYSVSQRTQEIGIRMALGQSSGDLQRGIVLQTLRLAAIGMLVGVPAAWILARTLRGLLFGVGSTDPVTFLYMVLVLTMVAASAGYLPARRASRIDPIAALRAD